MIKQFLCCFLITLLPVTVASGLHEESGVSEFGSPVEVTEEQLREAEQHLSSLGYQTGPIDGYPDEATFYAVIAFQRMMNQPPTGSLTLRELAMLRTAPPLKGKFEGFLHVEVSLSKQLLMLVNADATVKAILPISSGSEKSYRYARRLHSSRTPLGTFTIFRKVDGWRRSPLGVMYYPSYFIRGFAIHGTPSFSKSPSTHGCIAIPLFIAQYLSSQTPIGTTVMVYK